MKFFESLCESLTRALGLTAFTQWQDDASTQQPVGPHYGLKPIHGKETLRADIKPPQPLQTLFPSSEDEIEQDLGVGIYSHDDLPPGPIFAPPNAPAGFVCDYSAMRGWRHTAGSGMRTAWLEKPIMDSDATGGIYNIFTNYDQYAPIGTHRKVSTLLNLSLASLAHHGVI